MTTFPQRGVGGRRTSWTCLALLVLLSQPASPQSSAARPIARSSPGGSSTASGGSAQPLRNDHKGRWFNFNVAPIEPFVFEADGTAVYTLNSPGSRLVKFSLPDLERVEEVPTGPGLTTVRARPGTQELWCVDSLTSSITVVDRPSGSVTHTIPVGSGAHGLAFSASGDRAWVTCSEVDAVDVIATASYSVVNSIPIPARLPRAIVRVGQTVYVVPLRSGNGTAPRGNPTTGSPDDVRTLARPADVPGAQALPDRDLFAIPITGSPTTDALDPSATVSGLGTNLYNLHARPGTSEVWIPHTDALNEIRGERNFIDGQVVRNRIAVVDTATGNTRTIDLDALAPSPDVRIGTPTGIAFTEDGARAFVCGFGSSRVGVLDLSGAQTSWAGVIRIAAWRRSPAVSLSDAHSGAGSRCAAIDPDQRHLVVLNAGENSLTHVDLEALPSSTPFDYTAPHAQHLGWDPTPFAIIQGRVDLNRTDNSRSRTSSCASCHIDGHIDGLAWDLSIFLDPEGTPGDQLHYPIDDKGPLVTQTVRRLRETGPYHWRGERRNLRMFDAAFTGLLRREVDGEPRGLGPNFNYLRRYMEFLALRPNPRQSADRELRPDELEGLQIFSTKPVLDGLRCIDCHALPLGTSGAIVSNGRGGLAPTTVVPSLRDVAEKQGPSQFVGELFGRRAELGAGLGHGGAFADLEEFLLQERPQPHGGQRFDLTGQEADRLARFLEAFDTGLAPATMEQLTVRTTTVPPELTALLEQAQRGNCDVIYRRGPVYRGDVPYESGLYDPVTQTFRRASESLPLLTLPQLMSYAPDTPITFLGTPLWNGVPMALDRDNDGLLDLDEAAYGTLYELDDTDDDSFPDGYEVLFGMDPTVVDETAPDFVAPDWLGPPTIVYATQTTVKFEFHTNEQARTTVFVDGEAVERWPLKPHYDTAFSLAIGSLQAGTTHDFWLDLIDPAGNIRRRTFTATTLPRTTPAPIGVEDITLAIRTNAVGTQSSLHATVLLTGEDGAPPIGYNLVGSLYHSSPSGLVEIASAAQTWLVFPDGSAHFYVPLPDGLGAGELTFVVRRVDAPPGAPLYADGESRVRSATLDY